MQINERLVVGGLAPLLMLALTSHLPASPRPRSSLRRRAYRRPDYPQGLGVFELATVPDAGLRIDSIICRFGRLASSNAAIAFELGAHSHELYATSLYVDGVLQSRANGPTTLGDGTTIVRKNDRIKIALGRVRIYVAVQFSEFAGRVARVGWWQNVRVYSPIRDVLDPELTGLCAHNASTLGADEVPMLASNETVFDTNATRYTELVADCGFDDAPTPLLCENPGTVDCCPALPTLDDAEVLCSVAIGDGEAYPRCLSPTPSSPQPPPLLPPILPLPPPPPPPPPPQLSSDSLAAGYGERRQLSARLLSTDPSVELFAKPVYVVTLVALIAFCAGLAALVVIVWGQYCRHSKWAKRRAHAVHCLPSHASPWPGSPTLPGAQAGTWSGSDGTYSMLGTTLLYFYTLMMHTCTYQSQPHQLTRTGDAR
ncbi:hypothetical protein T492DRAFT_841940 [Pavlovales sp. CCMP2436]|nr:hypothetical protein T492DRAFT_841940 [Pavlovales sp. CCMP2436]